VFKSADKDGQPFGALDEVERAFVINKEDLLSAVERLPNIVDVRLHIFPEGSNIYAQNLHVHHLCILLVRMLLLVGSWCLHLK
jgi:hypothetical protein